MNHVIEKYILNMTYGLYKQLVYRLFVNRISAILLQKTFD